MSMNVSEWLSVGPSDSGTDNACQTQEPEKVSNTKWQYDIDGRFGMMFSWTDKVSNTKSHYDIDERIGLTSHMSFGLRNRQGFKHSINQLVQETERIPSTKSHWNVDKRVGMIFCSAVRPRNRTKSLYKFYGRIEMTFRSIYTKF